MTTQVGRLGRTVAVSFTNLMELRFVSEFAKAGVRLNEIRAILDEVKDVLKHPHPFATRTVFRTKKSSLKSQKKNGVEVIYDLKSKNYEMHVVVLKSLKENVLWDPRGNALAWFPRPNIAPHVLIHPSHSFGRPILVGSKIPTEAIAEAVEAEGSAKTVAYLFEIPEKQVREAVRFHRHLRKAA